MFAVCVGCRSAPSAARRSRKRQALKRPNRLMCWVHATSRGVPACNGVALVKGGKGRSTRCILQCGTS